MVTKAIALGETRLPVIDDDQETARFVKYWFGPKQSADLRRLVLALPSNQSPVGQALRVVLSRLIITKDRGASRARDVSHSRPHRVYNDSEFDVLRGFQRTGERLAKQLEEFPPPGGTKVYHGDARRLTRIADHSVDLVLTSPPYLNAIDYLRGHRLALVWLGHRITDLAQIRSMSIGTERGPERAVPAIADEVARTILDANDLPTREGKFLRRYLADLDAMLGEGARVLRPGAPATFVIGNSTRRGVLLDNASALAALAQNRGFKLQRKTERVLPDSRRYLPPPVENGQGLALRMRTEVVLSMAAPT